MRKSDVSIQINQITIQIYLRSYDISVTNPLIEENMFLQMFDLTCISLLRAQSHTIQIISRLQLKKIYTLYRYTAIPTENLNHATQLP